MSEKQTEQWITNKYGPNKEHEIESCLTEGGWKYRFNGQEHKTLAHALAVALKKKTPVYPKPKKKESEKETEGDKK